MPSYRGVDQPQGFWSLCGQGWATVVGGKVGEQGDPEGAVGLREEEMNSGLESGIG